MPRILLVKLSSLGDVIHNFPVVTDIRLHRPDMTIDWITEAPYTELVRLHPGIDRVYPLSLRDVARQWWSPTCWRKLIQQKRQLQETLYDYALDTQGLLKSAAVTNWISAPGAGFGPQSAREPLAARFYAQRYEVPRDQHAVMRNRALAAAALNYRADNPLDYGLTLPAQTLPWAPDRAYVVFLHASSRENKKWPLASWIALGRYLSEYNIAVVLPWGNLQEQNDSRHIAAVLDNAIVPPAMSLGDAALMLGSAQVVIGVDTGLAHLAVALHRPTVGLYMTTSPARTGLYAGDQDDTGWRIVNLGGGTTTAPTIPSVDAVWGHVRDWITP